MNIDLSVEEEEAYYDLSLMQPLQLFVARASLGAFETRCHPSSLYNLHSRAQPARYENEPYFDAGRGSNSRLPPALLCFLLSFLRV